MYAVETNKQNLGKNSMSSSFWLVMVCTRCICFTSLDAVALDGKWDCLAEGNMKLRERSGLEVSIVFERFDSETNIFFANGRDQSKRKKMTDDIR